MSKFTIYHNKNKKGLHKIKKKKSNYYFSLKKKGHRQKVRLLFIGNAFVPLPSNKRVTYYSCTSFSRKVTALLNSFQYLFSHLLLKGLKKQIIRADGASSPSKGTASTHSRSKPFIS